MQGAALLASPAAASPFAASFVLACSTHLNVKCTKASCLLPLSSSSLQRRRRPALRAQPQEQDYIAYDEKKSVFPAEACEEVGGAACEVEGVGPEVKGSTSAPKQPSAAAASDGPDREYVDYKESKTVFPGEACDDLGGEFCESEYQSGVYPEKAKASN